MNQSDPHQPCCVVFGVFEAQRGISWPLRSTSLQIFADTDILYVSLAAGVSRQLLRRLEHGQWLTLSLS